MSQSVQSQPMNGEDGLSDADRIMLAKLNGTIEDMNSVTPKLNALIYGDSGVGKTVEGMALLQAIVPANKRILFFDTGEGWSSLQNHPRLKLRTDRMAYKALSQINGVIDFIRRGVGQFAKYGGIQIDELNNVADRLLDKMIGDKEDKDPTRPKDFVDYRDYRPMTRLVDKMVTDLVSLEGVHVMFVAHERFNKAPNNLVTIGPKLVPSLSDPVRQQMNLVAHMTNDEVMVGEGEDAYLTDIRHLRVHPSAQISAKSRIGGLQPVVTHKDLKTQLVGWLNGTVEDVTPAAPPVVVEPPLPETDDVDDAEGIDPVD